MEGETDMLVKVTLALEPVTFTSALLKVAPVAGEKMAEVIVSTPPPSTKNTGPPLPLS